MTPSKLKTFLWENNLEGLRLGLKEIRGDELGPDGESVLHAAATSLNLAALKLILDSGANPNVKSDLDETPLMLAAGGDGMAAMSLLLDYGADPNLASKYGNTALHRFCGVNELNWMNAEPDGADAFIEELIEKGGDVNKKNNEGMSPLEVAARKRWGKMAMRMAKAGGEFEKFLPSLHTDMVEMLLAIKESKLLNKESTYCEKRKSKKL